jgi:RNA polymerase sigma-70 factor (ECF subfamily)
MEGVFVDGTIASDHEARDARHAQMLASHQLDIHFYVRSLVLNRDAVAEIVQNTNLALWEMREQFDEIKNFRAWAFQIARYRLLEYRAQSKRKGVCFSDALVDQLALQSPHYSMNDDDLMDDLKRCVTQLTATDRDLLAQRYSLSASCESIAQGTGRPVRWVYKALSRIRQELADCVARCRDLGRERWVN